MEKNFFDRHPAVGRIVVLAGVIAIGLAAMAYYRHHASGRDRWVRAVQEATAPE